MKSDQNRYASARAVEQAIKDAAKTAHEADPSRQVNDLIRQVHYDRFLCRVFSQGDESDWVLKGGSGMLARIPNARRTLDADLFKSGYDKDQALAELRRLAAIDSGDFFSFVYRGHRPILADDLQPYADGYRVTFDSYLGVTALDPISVDLSAHEGITDNITVAEPANRLALPKLHSVPYRLYPLVNQIADKVCATLASHRGRPSSREKDAVDLVVISVTQVVDAEQLREAISTECRRRHLPFPSTFTIPSGWGARYAKQAKGTPAQPYDIVAAQTLMDAFIGTLLTTVTTGTWDPDTRMWDSIQLGSANAQVKGQDVVVTRDLNEVSLAEAALMLGMSRPLVRKLMDRGILPFRMVGAHYRIAVDDVNTFLAVERGRRKTAMAEFVALENELGLTE